MLYKYMPFARLDVLENALIRFTQPGDFNDPFELHPSFDLMSKADLAKLPDAPQETGSTGPKMKLLTPEALHGMLSTLMPGIQRVVRTATPSPQALSLDNNLIARSVFDERFGILSLTESPTNLLMWAHYADSHKGFVLQFDPKHEFFAPQSLDGETLELTRVEYLNDRPILSYSTINSHALYYRKSPAWSYEVEYRLIRPLSGANKVLEHPIYPRYLFKLPHAAVTAIIIGQAMPHENRIAIFKLCERPEWTHLKIFQVALSNDYYALEIQPPLNGVPDPSALKGRVLSAR